MQKERKLISSLSKKLVITILLVSSIFTTVITFIALYIDYEDEMYLLSNTFDYIEKSVVTSVAQHIWETDFEMLDKELNYITQLPNIVQVKVYKPDSKTLIQATPDPIKNRFLLVKTYALNIFKTDLGAIEITASKNEIYQKILAKAIYVFVSQGIKTFGVSLILLMVFRHFVTRHLVKISRYTSNFNSHEQSIVVPLLLERKRERNELDDLVDAINSIVDEVCKHNIDLLKCKDNLEKLIDERTKKLKDAKAIILQTAHAHGMEEVCYGALRHITKTAAQMKSIVEKIDTKNTDSARRELLTLANEFENEIENTGNRNIIMNKIIKACLKSKTPLLIQRQGELDYIEEIEENLKIIKNTIPQLHEMAKGGLFIEKFSLGEFIENQIAIFEKAISTNVTIKKDVTCNPNVKASKSRLSQVLLHILTNAVEAIKSNTQDTGFVKVALYKEGKDKIICSISDNGIGIEQNNLNKIFGLGYTTKKEYRGFGLHHCANVMTEMKGKLEATSTGRWKGSTFKITLNSS